MAWLIILCSSLLLQFGILLRGLVERLLAGYSFFYTYVFSTFAGTAFVLVLWLWRVAPASYQRGYWILQFATLLIGCGIMLEIFRHVLSPYRGAEKFAMAVGLFTFGVVFCFAVVYRILAVSADQALYLFERNVRTVQAVFLCGILGVVSYYRIPIGKNLKGMISGYGLYIVTSLFTLAVRAYAGPQFNSAWSVIQPLSFDVSLGIWLVALWSSRPNPAPDPAIPLESDYEALAARTRRALVSMRSNLTGRP